MTLRDKQSYQLEHKEKEDSDVLAIEEEGVPWFYDIIKFLELRIYPNGADREEHRLVKMMAMQYILCGG